MVVLGATWAAGRAVSEQREATRRAIRQVAERAKVEEPTVTRRLIAEFASQPTLPRPRWPELTGITGRESEVLMLIASGLSNMEIAQRLCISLPTVKTHVGSLLSKCGARDRAQLVIAAYENGLVLPAISVAPGAARGAGRAHIKCLDPWSVPLLCDHAPPDGRPPPGFHATRS